MRVNRALAAACLAAVAGLAGCHSASGESASTKKRTITVYSGRGEKLIGPALERFEASTGVAVRVRYGDNSEMVATLEEEGASTPAQLFLSQDAAALESLSRAGLLKPLAEDVLALVPEGLRSGHGDWIGLSGRARCLVYNTERIKPEELPQSLEELARPDLKGPFGIAPGNSSFQAQMAAYLVEQGEEALRRLLEGLARNNPRTYPKNGPIVDAVIAGEIDWGLVNHYYLLRALEENPQAPAKNWIMPRGAASHLVDVAGAAAVGDGAGAEELVRFLLSEEAQRYFAEETREYPLARGLPADLAAPPELQAATRADYAAIGAALERTQALILASGLTRLH